MASPCDKVDLFVDGELSPEEAEAFRLHLPDCATCEQALMELLQLKALGRRNAGSAPAQVPAPTARTAFRPRWSHRPGLRVAASLAAALLMAVGGVVVRQHAASSAYSAALLADHPERLLEPRVSFAAADTYRPKASVTMGGGNDSGALPYEQLAVLQRDDPRALVAAYLVRDNPALAEQALGELKQLEHSPDLDSDRAAAMLLKGQPEAALRLTDAALAQSPHHPQALWNRGLALRELGLPLLAARAFDDVAALHEPGWSQEALEKAQALRRAASGRQAAWKAISTAGEALLDSAPASLPAGFHQSPGTRRLFYDAVRAAPSRERVLALLPVAQELDAQAGGHVLEGYVRRVAEADFDRRAPLARDYADLLEGRLPAAEKERFLAQVLQSKEDDILMGALVVMEATARHMKEYEARAIASGDPWFPLLAAQERAKLDMSAGRWTRAAQTLLEARRRCERRGLEYRCISIDLDLSSLYIRIQQADQARMHTLRGWKAASAGNEWGLESRHLWNLAQLARFSSDAPMARAYLGEFLERDRDNLDTRRRVHQDLAILAMQELRVDEARAEINEALATGVPLALSGAHALADIARLRGAPGDEEHLTHALEKSRPTLSQGESAIATHVLGRLVIERDVERGRGLLWRAIQEAEALELREDQAARRARAYSFTSLVLEAGRRQAFEEALRLFERERGLELPRRCLLAATVDSERTLLIALGASGELIGHFDEARRQPLPSRLDGLVPQPLLAALRGCEQVDVLARPPLHGRAGLLPPDMAWSYLTRTAAPPKPPVGGAVHLVVSEVELPRDIPLKRLNTWNPSFGPDEQALTLTGAGATPSRVLSAMKTATEIDLVTHGVLNGDADASYLLLAPENEVQELGASEVRAAPLNGAPFVVLAACHAAHTTYSLDEPFSLPAAFIQAGARGVLAATEEIPDLEASLFFNAVREHIRSGMAPALALRQERVRWLKADRGAAWIESVLLFE